MRDGEELRLKVENQAMGAQFLQMTCGGAWIWIVGGQLGGGVSWGLGPGSTQSSGV
jgi:hypothetical protein